MVLCFVDNFLGVVQQEGAKQDKATIDSDAVHASGVPGSPGQDGATEEADWSNDSAHDSTVCKPGSLLGANSRGVRDAASNHAAANHGCDAHSHGDETAPANQVHGCWRPVDSGSCSCSRSQA